MGNWLSARQAQALLNAPDITTLKGLRDRAILAVLLAADSGDLKPQILCLRISSNATGSSLHAVHRRGVAEDVGRNTITC
jgi:site-specific recombinase XerD